MSDRQGINGGRGMSARAWVLAGIAAAGAATAGTLALRYWQQRRDPLVAALAGQLAISRESEGTLREQNGWLRAAVDGGMTPLRLVPGYEDQAPRRSASSARMS